MLVRWGIRGCGKISSDFVNSLGVLPEDEHVIVAVCAGDLERGKKFVKETKSTNAKVYDNENEFHQDPNIDIIYVGQLNHQHHDAVIAALNAKKHVLCEKPLALNEKQAREMVECAKKNNKFLMEAYWSRFFPVWQQLRQLIDDQVIGEVLVVNADFGLKFPNEGEKMTPKFGGGALMSTGCYLPMLATFVYKDKPELVRAVAAGDEKGESCNITLKFKGNKIANLQYTGLLVTPCEAIICGTEGYIKIPDHFWCPSKLQVFQNRGREAEMVSEFVSDYPKSDEHFNYPNSSALSYEARHVRECLIKELVQSPIMPLEESISLAQINDKIRKDIGLKFECD